jgi:hypothetical protein
MPTFLRRCHPERSEGTPYFAFAVASLACALAGCQSAPLISRNECFGSYEAHLGDKATGKVCFILREDGTYALGDPQPKEGLGYFALPSNGSWQLHGDSTGQQLFIDKTTLPITREKISIRVNVNDDLGMYCDLPRGR